MALTRRTARKSSDKPFARLQILVKPSRWSAPAAGGLKTTDRTTELFEIRSDEDIEPERVKRPHCMSKLASKVDEQDDLALGILIRK